MSGALHGSDTDWTTTPPTVCPGCGRPYSPGRVTVGWSPCRCQPRHGHRTYLCSTCECVLYEPPREDSCREVGIG